MDRRQQLHDLIDRLPEHRLETVAAAVRERLAGFSDTVEGGTSEDEVYLPRATHLREEC